MSTIQSKENTTLPGVVCRKVAEKRQQSHLEEKKDDNEFNVTAIYYVYRFYISTGLYQILTDYQQGKAIAQRPQVGHQVHQNQKLTAREERDTNRSTKSVLTLHHLNIGAFSLQRAASQPAALHNNRRNWEYEGVKLPIRVLGFPITSHWMWLGPDMGHPHRRKGMWMPLRNPLAVCHVTYRPGQG